MRKLLGWSLVLSTAACGNDFVFRSDDFDRVAALRLCTENGDRFDGLEVRVVPGPVQTPAGEPSGCVRLRFRADGEAPTGLALRLAPDLPLVEGERTLQPSCLEAREPGRTVALQTATGAGELNGDELTSLEAELDFVDGTMLRLDVDELGVLQQDCDSSL